MSKYKIVPLEPTDEMMRAMRKTAAFVKDGAPLSGKFVNVYDTYRDGIKAAPETDIAISQGWQDISEFPKESFGFDEPLYPKYILKKASNYFLCAYSGGKIKDTNYYTVADGIVSVDLSEFTKFIELPKPTQEVGKPWYPPVPEGYGEWIELPEGEFPKCKRDDFIVSLLKDERNNKSCKNESYQMSAGSILWEDNVVAYCVKLPEPKIYFYNVYKQGLAHTRCDSEDTCNANATDDRIGILKLTIQGDQVTAAMIADDLMGGELKRTCKQFAKDWIPGFIKDKEGQ